MIIIFNLTCLFLIAFIIAWFWFTKSKAVQVTSHLIKITIKNGLYFPARIEVNTNQPIILEFLRKDTAHYAKWVNFTRLNVRSHLPFNTPHQVSLGPLSPGIYPFSCQMQKYHGELIVIRK